MYATSIDDGFSDVRTIPKPGTKRITASFNAALFCFQAIAGLMASERASRASFEGILISTTLDLGRFLVVMLITAYFIRAFWERLVASVVAVRCIDFQEALAIALIVGLLGGRWGLPL